ncbi:PEP-CTERM sorting domain-containing protein [bacterium]|nr:PEP-CTERM sorting domain-containing protein [bacterium]
MSTRMTWMAGAAAVVTAVSYMSMPARALEVQIGETGSSMIMPQPAPKAYAGTSCYVSNVNPSIQTSYCLVNPVSGYPTAGLILWYFDLSAYTGRVVTGDAQLTIGMVYGDAGALVFRHFECLNPWDETVVTWENYLGPGMTNNPAFTNNFHNYFGPEISMAAAVGNANVTWIMPSNVIQRWINDPSSNRGIAMRADWYANKQWWNRAATWQPLGKRPVLVVSLSSNNQKPNTPTNMTPVNGTTAMPLTGIPLTASPFSDQNGDAFSNSQWQISADASFASPAWDSGAVAGNTNITATPLVPLQYSTRYYWRVRYRDGNAEEPEWSSWSAPTYFDTALNLMQAQVRTVNENVMIAPGRTDAPASNRYDFANSNLNGRVVTAMNPINATTNIAPAGVLMYWFDLRVFSQYSGMSVDNDGDLTVGTIWTDVNFPPNFKLYAILQGWPASNVTWNSFVGADWGTWATKFGTELDAQLIDTSGAVYHWTVPKTMIQNWIDNPTQNFGIALIPEATGNSTFRTQLSSPPPTLTFDLSTTNAVPPAQPTNVSPADGAINLQLTPTLESSAYSGASPQGAAQWQIATEPSFAAPIWDVTSTSAFTQITVVSNVLQFSGRYYWRVRHTAIDGGKSLYSVPTKFDTEVKAGTFKRLAAQNAMILLSQPASNYNGGAESTFWPMPASNGVCGIIMCWFDLGIFSGLETESNATFMVRNAFVDPNFGAINFVCYELLKPFNEAAETWSSYVGGASYTNYFGESFGPQTLPLEFFGTTTWEISQALIQKWLDSPETNFGLAIMPETSNGNAVIHTRRNAATSPALLVSVVPEPAALALVALGALAMWRKRN